MSDTPRTDTAWETLPSVYEFIAETRRMERELNEANAKIKRLEEARGAMEWWCCNNNAVLFWRKAKEDKLCSTTCNHCLRLEDECTCCDADVCADMGDK